MVSIINWSSNGSQRENDKDIMYLATPGEDIIFSVIIDESCNYEWTINKINQEINDNNIIFTIPNEKGIWEIYIKAYNVNGEAHHKWVVSTLSNSEAPDLFEYFTDGKYEFRTDSDPWGRPLPEWTARTGTPNITNRSFASESTYASIDAASSTIYGTWIYKFKFSAGGSDYSLTAGVYPILYDRADYPKNSYRVLKGADEHLWLDYFDDESDRYPIAYSHPGMVGTNLYCIDDGCVSGKTGIGRNWHELRVIHDTDGVWYMWLDDDFVPYSNHWLDNIQTSDGIGLRLTQPDSRRVQIDCVEVYHNTFIFPEITNTYESGSVIVKGWSNTLSSVANDINNANIFSYDAATKSATSYVHLTLDRGAKLTLTDETLTFDLTDPYLYVKPGFNLILVNSTITTKGTSNILHYRSPEEGHQDNVYGWSISASGGNLVMRNNSKIEKVNRMLLTALINVDISDSSFVDLLGTHDLTFRPYSYRNHQLIKNVTLTSSSPSIPYSEWAGQIYDSTISGSKLSCRGNMYFINTTLTSVTLIDYYKQNRAFQYYLDIKVVDSNGDPVSGAIVSVTNEIDNENYPAENMSTGWEWAHPTSGQTSNWYRKWIDANKLEYTTTCVDGHTPLPSDGANTIIITDYNEHKSTDGAGSATRTNFTYTITISKDGKTASMSGLDINGTWYRENPNTYQNTVTIVLPTTIETGTISGIVTDKATSLPISDVKITANGYYTFTE